MAQTKEKSRSRGYGRDYYSYEYERRHRGGAGPYGAGIRPEEARPARTAKQPAPVPRADKARVLLLLAMAGLIGVGVTLANTCAASIKRDINQTLKETAEVQVDIESLEIKIDSLTGIEAIESRATEELGMAYPAPGQFIFIEEEPAQINDFAQHIMENAYELW
jgi:cell division protein FtsL